MPYTSHRMGQKGKIKNWRRKIVGKGMKMSGWHFLKHKDCFFSPKPPFASQSQQHYS